MAFPSAQGSESVSVGRQALALPNSRPSGSRCMPSVCVKCEAVNPVNPEEYATVLRKLQPCDVPCVYCPHLYTYVHGYYLRRPFDLGEIRHDFLQQRRQCPDCKRTFTLLPSFVAPFQRYTVVVQDLLASLLAGTLTVNGALTQLAACGICLSESSARCWFTRVQAQVSEIIALFSRIVQFHRPDVPLPSLRRNVRDSVLCAYYDRLALLGVTDGSGFWNLRRQVVCLFAPSLSVNRVSYGLSPASPP